MRSNYKPIGELVTRIDERNTDGEATELIGVSINKCFIKSVANTIGTDLTKYKIIRKDDFAVSLMQVSRDSKIPVARQTEYDIAIMSPAYPIFRVTDKNVILPEYLDMWFKRSEFDREAAFIAVGGVRGSMPWDEFAQMEVHVPDIETQKKIVHDYQIIEERIELKRKINDNLTKQLVAYNKLHFSDYSNNLHVIDYCSRIYSGGTPSTLIDEYWNGDNPWLSSGETSNSYISSTIKSISNDAVKNSSTKLAKKGSVVIASAGQGLTRGQTSMLLIDTYVNQSVIVLEPKEGFSGFLYSNLKGRYDELRNISDLDSIRGSLTTKTLSSMPMPLCTESDACDFEKASSSIFKTISNNIREITDLEQALTVLQTSISSR